MGRASRYTNNPHLSFKWTNRCISDLCSRYLWSVIEYWWWICGLWWCEFACHSNCHRSNRNNIFQILSNVLWNKIIVWHLITFDSMTYRIPRKKIIRHSCASLFIHDNQYFYPNISIFCCYDFKFYVMYVYVKPTSSDFFFSSYRFNFLLSSLFFSFVTRRFLSQVFLELYYSSTVSVLKRKI